DAVADLPDLLLAVAPRVGRVRFQLIDRPIDDQHLMREIGRPAARSAKVLHQTVLFLGWGDPARCRGTGFQANGLGSPRRAFSQRNREGSDRLPGSQAPWRGPGGSNGRENAKGRLRAALISEGNPALSA